MARIPTTKLSKRLEKIYEKEGYGGVFEYAGGHPKQFDRDWLHCRACDTETPRLLNKTKDCAVCGQVYEIQIL